MWRYLDPATSLRYISVDGTLTWGLGPIPDCNQLALAVLYDSTGNSRFALKFYEKFRKDVVDKWLSYENWEITEDCIDAWLFENIRYDISEIMLFMII